MGVSSDGLLVFGFKVGEETDDGEPPAFMGEHDDFDEWLAVKAGKKDAPYKERAALVDACPAALVMYCSYDYPMYILAVRGAKLHVYRGHTAEVTSELLAVSPERIAAFHAWCEENGITYQEPKWLLASMYG